LSGKVTFLVTKVMMKQLLFRISFLFSLNSCAGVRIGSSEVSGLTRFNSYSFLIGPHLTQSPAELDEDAGGGGIDKFDIFTQNFVHPIIVSEEEEGEDSTPFQPPDYTFNELDMKATEIPNCGKTQTPE